MVKITNQHKAAGIKMRAISPLTDFSFDFHDLDLISVDKLLMKLISGNTLTIFASLLQWLHF